MKKELKRLDADLKSLDKAITKYLKSDGNWKQMSDRVLALEVEYKLKLEKVFSMNKLGRFPEKKVAKIL